MYQYFTSLSGYKYNTLLRPGYNHGVSIGERGIARNSMSTPGFNHIVKGLSSGTKNMFDIEFRHGGEFVDTIGYMKKVIKETIDSYGTERPLNDQNMIDKFWFSDKVGLLKPIQVDYQGKPVVGPDGRISEVSWNANDPAIKHFKRNFTEGFLRPLSDIFNLGLGYETLQDGSKRNLGFYDHIRLFNKAKQRMSMAGKENPELKPFIEDFLGFLGENPGAGGTSNHPLIAGLIKMNKSHNEMFPERIERTSILGNILHSGSIDVRSKEIQQAINKYMADEGNWAKFKAVQWEVNKIEDIMNDMRHRRQNGTSQYDKLEQRKDLLTNTLGQVELIANKEVINNMSTKSSRGSVTKAKGGADANYAIYKVNKNTGEVQKVIRIRKGEEMFWNERDVVVKNPRTFRFADPIQQKHLRSMYLSFGNVLHGVDRFDVQNDLGYIKDRYRKVMQDFRDIDSQFSDRNVKNSEFYSDLYTVKLEALKSEFMDIMGARGTQYAKQFLHRMLVPRVSTNEMSMLNYDNVTESYYSGFRFRNNKINESLVMRFMKAAMDNKVSGLNEYVAKEWFKEIEQTRKIGYLMVHDRSLQGDAFKIGNFDRHLETHFNVIPDRGTRPKFLNAKLNNEEARKTMQSYMTGSYFLNPIELYRLTAGLDKKMNEMIDPATIGNKVKDYWQDVGENTQTVEFGEGVSKAVYRISKVPQENQVITNREHMRNETASDKIKREYYGCPDN